MQGTITNTHLLLLNGTICVYSAYGEGHEPAILSQLAGCRNNPVLCQRHFNSEPHGKDGATTALQFLRSPAETKLTSGTGEIPTDQSLDCLVQKKFLFQEAFESNNPCFGIFLARLRLLCVRETTQP